MDHTLLKNLIDRSCEALERQLMELNSIWTDCGYDHEEAVRRGDTVYHNVFELLKDMLEEEYANKKQFIDGVENLLKEATTLSEELNVHIDTNSCLNVPLYKLEETLSLKLEKYQKIKADRLSRYEGLIEREDKLCSMLGIEKSCPFPNKLVTEQQLSELEEHVTSLSQKEAALRERFMNTKTNIISMLRELEETPKTEIEKEVVGGEDSDFRVTSNNMAKVQELHEELEKRLDQKQQYVHQLREKLNLLWVRLRENTLHQAEFLRAYPGFSNSTITALKKEIERCEDKKKQNIAFFIFNIRQELEDLWEQCFYSKEDRLTFLPFSSETFNEELLELHEYEVQKLRNEFEHNKDLYYLVRDWKKITDSLKVLNERSADKTRLFKNRGGELLKEEKERKLTERRLKKIEEEIINLLNKYEAVNTKPFLYFGDELRKMLQRKKGVLHESKVKESCKKSENLATGCKRKIPVHTTSNTKRTKQHLPETCDSKASRKLDFPKNERCVLNNRLEHARDDFDDDGYNHFQRGIERINERGLCRSTLISGVLKPKNGGRGVRSPTKAALVVKSPLSKFRTPVKPPRKFIGTPLTSPRTPQNHLRERPVKGRPSSAPRPRRLL